MNVSTMLSLAVSFSIVGIALTLMALVPFLLGYSLIYRRILKGQKRLSLKKLSWWVIFFCYLFVVLAATLLMRSPSEMMAGQIYPLFYAYVEALVTCSAASWRNIIFNYCMFIPFGFLLSLRWEKLRSAKAIFLSGFSFSLMIESLQLITRRGMFEFDDLLGNTVGALIGYGIFCLLRELKALFKKKPYPYRNGLTVISGSRSRKAQ